jgi:two-component system response regulator BaeR
MEPLRDLREAQSLRLLMLYADLESAAALARRLRSSDRELILCPSSIHVDNWLSPLQPDLILLQMPEGARDMLLTCESVRSRTNRPIVALAPAGDELLVASVLGLGVDEYFPLPMGDHELLARLDALLRRLPQHRAAGEHVAVGDLTLSSGDHSVERNGRKIGLSPIEHRLLACLISAPGTVMTHQTLMARVWGA